VRCRPRRFGNLSNRPVKQRPDKTFLAEARFCREPGAPHPRKLSRLCPVRTYWFLYRTSSLLANFILLAEATGKPDLGGVKRNGVTGLLPEVTWSEDFRERVVLMPSISSDFAARLAADLRARRARVFYGHSDFGFPPGHIEIDTRQVDGLRTFYRKVAAENERIDLCIHCLAKQPLTGPTERFDSGIDARTVFVGTLLAAQYLKSKEGVGTILNLALLEATGLDLAMVGPAVDLVFDVTRFAAEVAPQKIRAFAVVSAEVIPLSGAYSRSAPQIELGPLNADQERRKLLRVIRHLLCDDRWLLCQPSGRTILST
jgi:hypothetical protein